MFQYFNMSTFLVNTARIMTAGDYELNQDTVTV